ncbi:ATP-binding protein [Neobacillus sp. MER 74]|uniref:ATP-binding protein n=1 Tax=Neobacillus sp. MER 74 TaxID=2939566 RepID=UPI0037CB0B55
MLTSNRHPKEWTELLGDVGVATTILECLIYGTEIVHYNNSSYRMKHREIFLAKVFKINKLNCSKVPDAYIYIFKKLYYSLSVLSIPYIYLSIYYKN